MIDNTDNYLVIEVPSQMPASGSSWDSREAWIAECESRAANSGGSFETWRHDSGEPDGTATEWVEHDLQSVHEFTRSEAETCLKEDGYRDWHQSREIFAALQKFVPARLEFRATNATDHILLVRAGSVVGQWDATPDSALDFANTKILGDGSADDWEETWPDVTDPDAWGERLEGDDLAMRISKILREDRWSAANIVPAIAAKLCVDFYSATAAEKLTPLTGQEVLPYEDDENFLAELLDRAPSEPELDKFRSEFWEIWDEVSTSKVGA